MFFSFPFFLFPKVLRPCNILHSLTHITTRTFHESPLAFFFFSAQIDGLSLNYTTTKLKLRYGGVSQILRLCFLCKPSTHWTQYSTYSTLNTLFLIFSLGKTFATHREREKEKNLEYDNFTQQFTPYMGAIVIHKKNKRCTYAGKVDVHKLLPVSLMNPLTPIFPSSTHRPSRRGAGHHTFPFPCFSSPPPVLLLPPLPRTRLFSHCGGYIHRHHYQLLRRWSSGGLCGNYPRDVLLLRHLLHLLHSHQGLRGGLHDVAPRERPLAGGLVVPDRGGAYSTPRF